MVYLSQADPHHENYTGPTTYTSGSFHVIASSKEQYIATLQSLCVGLLGLPYVSTVQSLLYHHYNFFNSPSAEFKCFTVNVNSTLSLLENNTFFAKYLNTEVGMKPHAKLVFTHSPIFYSWRSPWCQAASHQCQIPGASCSIIQLTNSLDMMTDRARQLRFKVAV